MWAVRWWQSDPETRQVAGPYGCRQSVVKRTVRHDGPWGIGACAGTTASVLWSGGRTPVLRTVKSWLTNDKVIARNSVARVSGHGKWCDKSPCFKGLALSWQLRASSETLFSYPQTRVDEVHQRHVTHAPPLCDWHTQRPITLCRCADR
jgi:hypothetical protein